LSGLKFVGTIISSLFGEPSLIFDIFDEVFHKNNSSNKEDDSKIININKNHISENNAINNINKNSNNSNNQDLINEGSSYDLISRNSIESNKSKHLIDNKSCNESSLTFNKKPKITKHNFLFKCFCYCCYNKKDKEFQKNAIKSINIY